MLNWSRLLRRDPDFVIGNGSHLALPFSQRPNPPLQIQHRFLFMSINHLLSFFSFGALTESDSPYGNKNNYSRGPVSHTGLKSARLLVKVCQVFLKPLSPLLPPPASSPRRLMEMLAWLSLLASRATV